MPLSTERATVFEGCQIGVESTAGTAVAANKRMLCTSIENLRPDIPTTPFRPYGSKASTSIVAGKGMGVGSITAAANPYDLSYLFSTAICTPAITTPGGGSSSRNWQFKPRNFAPDSFETLTVDKGSFDGGERATYGVVNGWSLNVNINENISQFTGNFISRTPDADIYPTGYEVYTLQEVGTVSGGTFDITPNGGSATANVPVDVTPSELQALLEANAAVGSGNVVCTGDGDLNAGNPITIVYMGSLFGTNPTDTTVDDTNATGGGDITITKVQDGATITDLDAVPIPTAEWDIYVADSFAGLPAVWTTGSDADSLLRCNAFTVNMPERWIPAKYLRTDHDSFSVLVENNQEDSTITIQHMANEAGRAYQDHLTAGTTLFMRAVGTGRLIEGSIYEGIMITVAFEVENYEPADANGVYDATITGRIVYQTDLAGFLDAQLRTDLTAL